MEKRAFQKFKEIPAMLGMGCMRFQTDAQEKIKFAENCELIDFLYASGVTYYDTAWVYHAGKSEDFVKKALVERYPRESFQIADKFPVWEVRAPEDVQRIFHEQLDRLGGSYIDFYLLHALSGNSWETCKKYGLYEYQKKLQEQGLIKYRGFSFHGTTPELKTILDESQFDFVQLQINYYDWEDYARDQYELATSYGLPVIVMEPVRGGTLSKPTPEVEELLRAVEPGQSPSQLALRWVGMLQNVPVVLSGMTLMEHARENVETFSPLAPLNETQLSQMALAQKAIRKRPIVPCTGCNYCRDCPSGVSIPDVFAAFNEYISFESKSAARWKYIIELPAVHRAHNCTECGTCVEMCPQSLDIPKELKRAEDCFHKIGIL